LWIVEETNWRKGWGDIRTQWILWGIDTWERGSICIYGNEIEGGLNFGDEYKF